MGKGKKLLIAVVCVALSAALCACSMVTVNEDKDNAQVVATVNGTEITKQEFKNVLTNMLYSYGMSVDQLNASEDKQKMLESALDEAVDQELLYQEAQKEGLVDDSEEKKAEVKEQLQSSMDSIKSYYEETAEANGESQESAEQAYNDYIKTVGYDDLDKAVQRTIRQTAISDMYSQIIDEVSYTEEEAKEYYNMQMEAQKKIIDEDASKFQLYQQFGESYYNPPEAKYVKNLLIAIPDDKQAEISALRQEGKDADADVLRDEELAKIKSEADEALKRVQAGEDFDTLIEELGDDPGMQAEPAKTYGYLVYEGSNYVDEFEQASLALTNEGETTGLVPTDFGYHIIKYVKNGAGAVDFDMVKDDIISTQESIAKNGHYTEYVDGLKENADIKTWPGRLELYS